MTAVPSTTWRMLSYRLGSKELPKGLDAAWDAAVGLTHRMRTRSESFLRRAERVVRIEKQYSDLADKKLRQQAMDLREVFRRGRETPEQLDQAFAVIREVAFRQLGERPFLVQVAGALAIDAGCITEMATGEGKTLTATMPATVAGWRGRGCHVITVNDYLARRDAEWMKKVYRYCGLNVGHIEQQMPPPERRSAYQADITYGTNKEMAADFLRDRLALGRLAGLSAALLGRISAAAGGGIDRLVQRGLHYAIVDEADSVLIDEAVTPLIISGEAPNPEQVQAFQQAAELVEKLTAPTHYKINERYREVDLTAAGKQELAGLSASWGGLWTGMRRREEMVTQALMARHFYMRGKQYVVDEKQRVVIVDEFTGRLMPDREWRDGLHQAVAAKEGLEVQPPKDTYARVSFQRFFRLYRKLSGMTGTATEGRREFWQIYHLPIVVIPTNRPCIRQHNPDRV